MNMPLLADAFVRDEPPAAPFDFARVEALAEPPELAALPPARPSVGDWALRFAYRRGLPARLCAGPFTTPRRVRLLATVENPLPGNRAAGTALRAGHFLVFDARIACDALSYPALSPRAARALHRFDWLADLEASAPREQCAPLADRLLADWTAAHPTVPRRAAPRGAWSLDNAAWRLLAWLTHAPLILSSSDRAARARTLETIEAHACWLDRQARRRGEPLARLVALAALGASGLLLAHRRVRQLHAEAELIHAFGALVGADGGVLSRSPLAQIEAIRALVLLRAAYRACRLDPPATVPAMLGALLPPLLALTHHDGSLGSWQGGHAIEPERIADLVAASGVRCRPLRDGPQWGYHRIAARESVLQVDAAPPPLPRHARDGCASTLAFELSRGDHRIVVNCGGAAATGGAMPAKLERGLRASAAHSTLVLDEANSTAVLADGRLGRGVGAVEIERATLPAVGNAKPASAISVSHDGYVGRYGLLHRRLLALADTGGELTGEDRLEPARRLRRRRKVGVAIRFHLGPDVAAFLLAGGQGAQLALPDGALWLFRADRGAVSVEDSVWVDGAGRPAAIKQLVLHDVVGREGGAFAWRFTLAG